MNLNKRWLVVVLLVALLLGGLAGGILVAEEPLDAFALGLEDDDAGEGPDEPITGEALEKASAAALDYLGEGRVTDTEVGDEEGYYEVEVTLDNGREVDVHLNEKFEVLGQEAEENGDDEEDEAEDAGEGPDEPITGDALDQASAAALDYVGEGRVTDTEVGDEEGYYEVEVTLDNGRQVDVHLSEKFEVLGQEADGQENDD